jgi:hypothetical protein
MTEFLWDAVRDDGKDMRYSVLPGCAADDLRLAGVHFRILAFLGRFNQRKGWCRLSQTKLAELFGVCRQTINKATGELVEWGYLEKQSQEKSSDTFCLYRTIIDRAKEGGEVSDVADTPRGEVSAIVDTGVHYGGQTCPAGEDTSPDHGTTTRALIDLFDLIDRPPCPPQIGKPTSAMPSEVKVAKRRGAPRRLACELAEDWQLPDEWHEWAKRTAPGRAAWVRWEAAKFADYWHGTGGRKADWQATWRNWWRKSCERPAPRTPPAGDVASETDKDRLDRINMGEEGYARYQALKRQLHAAANQQEAA